MALWNAAQPALEPDGRKERARGLTAMRYAGNKKDVVGVVAFGGEWQGLAALPGPRGFVFTCGAQASNSLPPRGRYCASSGEILGRALGLEKGSTGGFAKLQKKAVLCLQARSSNRLITSPCSRRPAPAALLNAALPTVMLNAPNFQAGGRRAAAEGDR